MLNPNNILGELGISFKMLKSLETEKPALDYYMQSVKDLQDYLQDANLFKPEILFENLTCGKDVFNPKRDSFVYDQRIHIKPVYDLRKRRIRSNGFALILESEPCVTQTCRAYGTIFEEPINMQRFPIMLSTNPEHKMGRFCGLAVEVLTCQLEPVTTQRLEQRLNETKQRILEESGQNYKCAPEGKLCSQIIKEIINFCLFEEALIVESVIKSWLLDATQFDKGDIINSRFKKLSKKISYQSLKQTKKVGPVRAIEYFSSYNWDVRNFLEGDFY